MNRKYESETLRALAEGWFIEAGGLVLRTLTQYRVGIVGAVFATRADADATVAAEGEALRVYGGEAFVLPVGDPLALMRRAAGEGLCGFQLFVAGKPSHRFMFMVRVEEAGRDLPTVLASVHAELGWSASLTRSRAGVIDHADVLHWERYDILDPVSGSAGQECPFRDWENGDPLFEIRSAGIVVLLAAVPLLGDWNSTQGSFAFFTSAEQAEHYRNSQLGDGHNGMLIAPEAPSEAAEAMASLRAHPLLDLKTRLAELAKLSPLAAWCVNPDAHRENSGCGRLASGRQDPTAIADANGTEVRMAAVSGIWQLEGANSFRRIDPNARWTGRDTIRWSGGQSLQLLPLDRSFASEVAPGGLDPKELTETEREELVAEYLGGLPLADCWILCEGSAETSPPLDAFYMVCWDSVTGDGRELPWRFSGVFDALRLLSAYELEHDRQHRTQGASSCAHVGFVGSGNAEFEDLRSARLQLGVRRIALRILRQGYRPSDAADIAALANGGLATLHVEYAGFAKDLLWASLEEQRSLVMEELGIDEEQWLDWESSADARVDPAGKAAVVARIGGPAWDTLEPRVRHFLSTALLHLGQQGHAPQLDYAPISLEIVKALEVELGALFESFQGSVGVAGLAHDVDDREESNLAAYLAGAPGRRPPTLGAMSYFLRPLKDGASDLLVAFHHYLKTLPNHAFLADKKFFRDGLMRVTNKYRNGGVHDSPISEEVCRDCVSALIGT